MFERFTERARQVVVLAQDEARLLGHNYIGTEHLLLGLLREQEGLAARVLESLGVRLDDARRRVGRIVGQGDEATTGQIPFTPRARKTLELSLREALGLGHNYIGTEHLLLGLVRDPEGVGVRVLGDLGTSADAVRSELLRQLGQLDADVAQEGARSERVRLTSAHGRRPWWMAPQVSFALGALTLGIGVLIGWAIGH